MFCKNLCCINIKWGKLYKHFAKITLKHLHFVDTITLIVSSFHKTCIRKRYSRWGIYEVHHISNLYEFRSIFRIFHVFVLKQLQLARFKIWTSYS